MTAIELLKFLVDSLESGHATESTIIVFELYDPSKPEYMAFREFSVDAAKCEDGRIVLE